jgi:hypothetical protein
VCIAQAKQLIRRAQVSSAAIYILMLTEITRIW